MHHTTDTQCPLCAFKLSQVDHRLVDWFDRTVKPFKPNVHVSWGYRDEQSQEQAVADGKSKLHYPDSAHNKLPAMALDLFFLEDGKATWPSHDLYEISQMMLDGMKWGGAWKSLGDADHFELRLGLD